MKDCTNNFKNWDVRVETPLGTIIARPDSEEPGIWVDLRRPDAVDDMELAFIGYSEGSKSPVSEKKMNNSPATDMSSSSSGGCWTTGIICSI